MDPTSIIAGGAIVTFLIWIALAVIFTDEQWTSAEVKTFVIGGICCMVWFVTVPIVSVILYNKRRS